MKTRKLRLALCLFLVVAPISLLGQNQPSKATKLIPDNSSLIASVTITAGQQNSTCVFVSNTEIEEWKAPRLEERILITYPEIESISIDWQSQTVNVVIPTPFVATTLEKIVKHFKYQSYVEN